MRGGGERWPEWAVQGEGEYGLLRAEENTLYFHVSHEGTPFSRWLVAHCWLPPGVCVGRRRVPGACGVGVDESSSAHVHW